jgi:hypothetical protein
LVLACFSVVVGSTRVGNIRAGEILGQAVAVYEVTIDLIPGGTSVCAPVELGVASPFAFQGKNNILVGWIDDNVADVPTTDEIAHVDPGLAAIVRAHHAAISAFYENGCGLGRSYSDGRDPFDARTY